MLIFLTVVTTGWALIHVYVDRRLLRPWAEQRSVRARRIARSVLWVAFLLGPLAMVATRWGGLPKAVLWFALVHMGALWLVFTLLLMRDIGLGVVRLTEKLRGREPDPERRRFLTNATGAGALSIGGVLTSWGLYEALAPPELVEVDVPIAGLSPALDGYLIAQISDIHIGPTIKRDFLAAVVARVNALEPDMIAVTGDLVDGSVASLRDDTAPLGDLRARDGAYFCTGNHEYYSGAEEWIEEVARLGLVPLVNEHRLVARDGFRLLVAGCTDYSAARVLPGHASDPKGAKEGAPEHEVSVLLAHQPKSIHAAAEAGYTLQLSGHTHGGQFFPVNLFVGLAHPFSVGLGKQDDTWIYVNRGTGYWGPPNRAGVASEITLIRLVRA